MLIFMNHALLGLDFELEFVLNESITGVLVYEEIKWNF